MESGTASGAIAIGRQLTAQPVQYERPILLGRRRCTVLSVPVKGARAEMKIYTDVLMELHRPSACYSVGMLPAIALVGLYPRT